MIVQLVYAFLIFLFPLALYSLALAYLNRSRRPVLVPGVWDAVGLLFGLSGFLLWTVPTFLTVLLTRAVGALPIGEALAAWEHAWLVWLIYYGLVAIVVLVMLALRRHKTLVYNVDPDRFADRLGAALAELGLDSVARGNRRVIAPAEAFTTTEVAPTAITADAGRLPALPALTAAPVKTLRAMPGGPRYAELIVDPFVAMRNVTLHWESYTPRVRREIESQLARTLADAVAPDNPAAGWFLSFSGLVFGAITLLAALFVTLVLFTRRS